MKGRYRVSVSHIILICLFLNAYFGLVTAPQPSTSTLTTEATSTSTIKPTQPPTTTAPAPTTPPPSPTTTAATTTTPPPTTTAAPTTTSPPPTTTEAATTAPPPKTTKAATITAAPTNTTAATDSKVSTTISTNKLTNATSTVSSATTPSTNASTSTPSSTSTKQTSTPTTSSTTTSTTTTTTAPTTTAGNNSLTSQTIPPETSTLSTAQPPPVTTTLSTETTNGTTATLNSSSPTTQSTSSATSVSTVASNGTQLTSTTTSLEQTTTGSSSNVPTTSLPATTSNESVATSTTTVQQGNQTTTTSSENGTSSSTEQTISSTTTGITSSTTSQSTSQQTTSKTLSTTQSVQTSTADPCDTLVCENNGTCLANSTATCSCVLGYTGEKCETNIEECKSDPCKNGGTCHDGINKFTCECPTGFNGTLCQNNIDDCLGNPCKNGANCTDLINSYECHCEAGYTGQNCTVDIDECASNPCEHGATCNDMVNMYNCTCIPGYNGTNCEDDIDDCVGEKCFNNGTCNDQVNNFTCTCTTGWKGHDCSDNINECDEKTHKCNRNANCTDTEGGYNCTCWEGFTGNGYICVDINECVPNSTVCSNNATCVNTPGDHRCVCAPGWTGDTCSLDINECNVTSACANNSNCTNTNGSYTCKCTDGYRGDGYHKCIEEVLIVVEDVGHTESGDDEIFGPYHVNKSLSLFGRMYNKFYVSINGYITFGNVINETYPPVTSSGWDRFEFPIIAPLWADIEIHGTNSGVEITNELSGKDLENVAKYLQVNSLRTGIVVTWKRAVPYPYTQNANFEAADFQVVIGATESNTYMMFNYDQEIFTWRTFSDRIVAAGYYFNDKNKLMTLDSNNFTSANMMNYDSSIKGRWIFNATSPSVEWKAKLACLAAVNTLETNVESSEPCPCSEAQAMRDTRFKFVDKKTIKGITVQQYVPRFKQPNERRQLCHYSSQYGSLIKGYPGGGYLETVNVTNAYKLCCNNSENTSCYVFYQKSPSDTCSSYLPPTWSLSWGDPHFTTFDGNNYTFNGRGEYTLLSLDDTSQSVKVQVRTEHIDDRKSATIFTGLAAQGGKTKIELLLMNRTTKTANLYINHTMNTAFPSTKDLNLDFDDSYITSSNVTLSIMFKSGLTIRVAVSDILSIVLSVPKDEPFKGKTSGLLGNNNGISTDDFIKKNGTVLPAGSNETTLYSFGQSWMLTKNESLFGYYNSSTNGRNFTFFNDPAKAKPVTFIADADNFTDILITNCNKTHGLNLTHCKGNKACIVDTIGSCQKDFGEMSLDTEENAIKEKELIDNMPPDLEIPNELYVGYSKNTSVELKFKQQSVVQVTCKTNIESKSYKCDNTMFSWNVSQSLRNSMVDLTIMAKDSLNAYSEYQPNIYYCGCEKADQCDYSLIKIDGPVNDNFFRARCVCPETQNGTYCEKKVNICDRNPCFENVTCNSTLDNPCGPCPAGLTGDGVKCYDIDECRTHQSNCEQICNNTIGGFTCSCREGYEVDGNTCKDIDECSSNSSYCDSRQNKYCVNTIGSADCLCMPGFTENGGTCVNVKEKHSYGGVLVFEATSSVSKEDLEEAMIDYLTAIFNTSVSTSGSVYFVELVSFIVLPSSRKKRDTSSFNKYKMDYIVHMNQSVPTENLTASLENTFNNLGEENGFVSPEIHGLNAVVKISTKDSKIISDKDGGICKMPGSVTCDDISTRCVSANGTYSCICREGFSGWANPYTSCKDIDECSPKPSTVCIGGKNCTNYPGSYLCHCEPGFRYEKPNCVDMCDSNPCQNGGQCIHGNTEGMYLCKCDDEWTGPNCENENSEAEKLKIIAIAVGASVGGVCLLLLCGLCGMYRRYRNRYSRYRRRPLSSMDFDSSLGLAGTNIRTKDFPIDDDTDTAFSIPRPKYNDNEYDMLRTNASSLNETSGKDTGKVEEQENQLPKVTKETSAYGNDNPSFLHSEDMEAARRSSKRSSKNAYDYF